MNNIKLIFVLLASLLLGACKSDDDDSTQAYTETSQAEPPVWQIDWGYNQERPNWQAPDVSDYENWTILKVQIEESLLPFVSEGDLMALFVNGELRGLAKPAVNISDNQTNAGIFLMKAYGNEAGTETVNMSLQYYNQELKQIFTLSEDISLDSDVTTGIDEDFIPQFTYGSAKYPLVKTAMVESVMTKVGLTPVVGNIAAAFVGDECRGTTLLSPSGSTSLVIYGRSAGENVTLKYYDAARSLLFTIPDALKL